MPCCRPKKPSPTGRHTPTVGKNTAAAAPLPPCPVRTPFRCPIWPPSAARRSGWCATPSNSSKGAPPTTLVKSLLHEYAHRGLRLVEVDKTDLAALPALLDILCTRPEKFIVFCDDLSFEEGEEGYKALKTALDGGLARRADNVLVYATSNRRHLMPEYADENTGRTGIRGEIHQREAVEEKVSLSDRFGLWLSFYPFYQEEYLAAAQNWLAHYGIVWDGTARTAALNWAQLRGSRSGRTAYQFACDWAGRTETERTAD